MSSSPTETVHSAIEPAGTPPTIVVTLPELEPDVLEATVVAWERGPGDWIEQDEPICVVSVGGMRAAVTSSASGHLLRLLRGTGDRIEPGGSLAEIQVATATADAAPAGDPESDSPEVDEEERVEPETIEESSPTEFEPTAEAAEREGTIPESQTDLGSVQESPEPEEDPAGPQPDPPPPAVSAESSSQPGGVEESAPQLEPPLLVVAVELSSEPPDQPVPEPGGDEEEVPADPEPAPLDPAAESSWGPSGDDEVDSEPAPLEAAAESSADLEPDVEAEPLPDEEIESEMTEKPLDSEPPDEPAPEPSGDQREAPAERGPEPLDAAAEPSSEPSGIEEEAQRPDCIRDGGRQEDEQAIGFDHERPERDSLASLRRLRRPAPKPVEMASFHSPAVRRLAARHNLDLTLIEGTGRGGRIRREDVVAQLASRSESSEPYVNGRAFESDPPGARDWNTLIAVLSHELAERATR